MLTATQKEDKKDSSLELSFLEYIFIDSNHNILYNQNILSYKLC